MKIATWNVNSLKVRLPQVCDWLNQNQPDILALQETKTVDEKFPLQEIAAAGYHAVFAGQKTYNGVAILSKHEIQEQVSDIPHLPDPQRRILAVTIAGVRIINLYVPNGESISSEKYIYKLDWLAKVADYIQQQLQKYSQLVVLGDFNIAPQTEDVHDPIFWQGRVLFSEPERVAFQRLLSFGLLDSFRLFNGEPRNFTWWDYRAGAFGRNQGLRIDHILISNELQKHCISCNIDKNPRKNQQPSDHTPVMVVFDL